jgi:hypothetical protein
MLSTFARYCAKWWLTSLLAFTLFGVQVLQESPLHDHAQETVDCALCHLQHLGDDSEVAHVMPAVDVVAQAVISHASHAILPSVNPSPYHGRAPPHAFS